MNIGIVGTGEMASALGTLWAGIGHRVKFGSRDPKRAEVLAKSIGSNATGGSIAEAGAFSNTILLATPGSPPLVEPLIKALGPLSGKIMIDCTNPLSEDFLSLTVGHTTSGAEEIAKLALDARVVKAFNTIASVVLASRNPKYGTQIASVFYCGDDDSAKTLVKDLIENIGYEAIHAGPLRNARYLEPLAELVIQLGIPLGMGTNVSFKLLQREIAGWPH
jgi:8-hydroxy-5-deazaflavin:NADPH oxidoreductase